MSTRQKTSTKARKTTKAEKKPKKSLTKKAKPEKLKAKKTSPQKAKLQKTKEISKKGEKYIYYFGDRRAEGNGKMKDILGGKGAGLAEMTNVGAPVPPGFTISTQACRLFYRKDIRFPKGLDKEVKK